MRWLASSFVFLLIAGCAHGPQQPAAVPLEGTYWKLTHLGDAPVAADERQREAHFILRAADKRVSGSGGCNGIGGNYELEGDRLRFGQMIRTMMACPTGMDIENGFLAALGNARTARVSGQRLILLDAEGRPLARFEAQPGKR
jgi:heat shock protein HslJ